MCIRIYVRIHVRMCTVAFTTALLLLLQQFSHSLFPYALLLLCFPNEFDGNLPDFT